MLIFLPSFHHYLYVSSSLARSSRHPSSFRLPTRPLRGPAFPFRKQVLLYILQAILRFSTLSLLVTSHHLQQKMEPFGGSGRRSSSYGSSSDYNDPSSQQNQSRSLAGHPLHMPQPSNMLPSPFGGPQRLPSPGDALRGPDRFEHSLDLPPLHGIPRSHSPILPRGSECLLVFLDFCSPSLPMPSLLASLVCKDVLPYSMHVQVQPVCLSDMQDTHQSADIISSITLHHLYMHII
jgi:hypothetical protein